MIDATSPNARSTSGNSMRPTTCSGLNTPGFASASPEPRIIAPMFSAAVDSNRSAPRPAQSPTLSPTRSAITAALRGSSSGIPEDDPRNAAVIADLVGDNVGDCAGRGADLFESTAAENIGAMILGVAIYTVTQNAAWILFPLVVRGFGLIASMIGIFTVRGSDTKSPMSSLNLGYYITIGLSIAGMFLVTQVMLNEKGAGYWFFFAGVVGIVTSLAFVYITQYYTAGDWRPVKEIAEAAKTGPATTIISGIAVGFETTAASAITIAVALFFSHFFGAKWGEATGLPHGGIYGTAVATMGMLMSAAFILAEDTFGPITDNAGGVASMARASLETR